jgi:hypothetical protein
MVGKNNQKQTQLKVSSDDHAFILEWSLRLPIDTHLGIHAHPEPVVKMVTNAFGDRGPVTVALWVKVVYTIPGEFDPSGEIPAKLGELIGYKFDPAHGAFLIPRGYNGIHTLAPFTKKLGLLLHDEEYAFSSED